jgi:hypothetical protein
LYQLFFLSFLSLLSFIFTPLSLRPFLSIVSWFLPLVKLLVFSLLYPTFSRKGELFSLKEELG